MKRAVHIVLSCEHAGNRVPNGYEYLFDQSEEILGTHLAWDAGSLELAQKFSLALGARLFKTSVTRLLVDCNRSEKNREVFSDYTRLLNEPVKKYLLDQYHAPYRRKVESYIAKHVERSTVLHLSIHTFTPIWHGRQRLVDVGLLFDENRQAEKKLGTEWKKSAQKLLDNRLILLNSPYDGEEDGLTTYLRRKFAPERYLGFEVEVNQKWLGTAELPIIGSALINALESCLKVIEK